MEKREELSIVVVAWVSIKRIKQSRTWVSTSSPRCAGDEVAWVLNIKEIMIRSLSESIKTSELLSEMDI